MRNALRRIAYRPRAFFTACACGLACGACYAARLAFRLFAVPYLTASDWWYGYRAKMRSAWADLCDDLPPESGADDEPQIF